MADVGWSQRLFLYKTQKWDQPWKKYGYSGTFLHRCFEAAAGDPERLPLMAESLGVPLSEAGSAAVAAAIELFGKWLKGNLTP